MKERMQKTSAQAHDFPQRARTESEWYEGVQTFMWMTEDNIVEVPLSQMVPKIGTAVCRTARTVV